MNENVTCMKLTSSAMSRERQSFAGRHCFARITQKYIKAWRGQRPSRRQRAAAAKDEPISAKKASTQRKSSRKEIISVSSGYRRAPLVLCQKKASAVGDIL